MRTAYEHADFHGIRSREARKHLRHHLDLRPDFVEERSDHAERSVRSGGVRTLEMAFSQGSKLSARTRIRPHADQAAALVEGMR